jgi:hypothetical protein
LQSVHSGRSAGALGCEICNGTPIFTGFFCGSEPCAHAKIRENARETIRKNLLVSCSQRIAFSVCIRAGKRAGNSKRQGNSRPLNRLFECQNPQQKCGNRKNSENAAPRASRSSPS